VERKIPVYGQLLSTWPAASGVLVHEGIAYVAAGIVNYDGTHVYALDAGTGRLKWQNNSSGHLDPDALAGVSVQGHMIVHDNKLWLAGGNVVSPAMFDLANGKCLNDVGVVHRMAGGNLPASESPRGGSSLFLVGQKVMVSDQPYYAHPKWRVYDSSVQNKTWLGSVGDRDFAWVNNARIAGLPEDRGEPNRTSGRCLGKEPRSPALDPLWELESKDSVAVALGTNALVVGRPSELTAVGLKDGKATLVPNAAGRSGALGSRPRSMPVACSPRSKAVRSSATAALKPRNPFSARPELLATETASHGPSARRPHNSRGAPCQKNRGQPPTPVFRWMAARRAHPLPRDARRLRLPVQCP
jgi:hypothetical protein